MYDKDFTSVLHDANNFLTHLLILPALLPCAATFRWRGLHPPGERNTFLQVSGAVEVLATVDEPSNEAEDKDDGDDDRDVVHRSATDGKAGGQEEADRGDEDEDAGEAVDEDWELVVAVCGG